MQPGIGTLRGRQRIEAQTLASQQTIRFQPDAIAPRSSLEVIAGSGFGITLVEDFRNYLISAA
jgi:hypothetical protein